MEKIFIILSIMVVSDLGTKIAAYIVSKDIYQLIYEGKMEQALEKLDSFLVRAFLTLETREKIRKKISLK